LTRLGRSANSTFFCPSEGKKYYILLHHEFLKGLHSHHFSLNCHVKSSSCKEFTVELGKRSGSASRYQVIWTPFPFFFFRKLRFVHSKRIKEVYIIIDMNK